jgi:hypothetical protein
MRLYTEGVAVTVFECICWLKCFKQPANAGGTFLYCAPDDARDGMEQFVDALAAVNLKCVNQQPCPEE